MISRAQATMIAALVAMTGCAGARTDVVAPTATVPVSLSRTVRDASGTLVGEDRRELVGTLDAEGTAWGMLYSGVKLTPEMDISQALNQEVQRLRGDAVVNVSIATSQCGWNWAPVVNLLPFWPGCANVHIHGDVIRVKSVSPAPAVEISRVAQDVKPTPLPQTKRSRTTGKKLARRTP